MQPATAGTTYNVAVVVGAVGEEVPATGTITVAETAHATITTYDFKNGDYSTLAKPSTTVTAGNFVAVKVVCESGYEVDNVKVNGSDTVFINGYYCLMQSATAGTTYNVVVTLRAAA